ncbi:OB-fold nucleic acid binding domain-containing protein [Halorussus gelatinilyticus]|uniref:OB-fold nucleic acid binding domain-containing protein n=1 Tax=Halorussus gelatinilyticus TaxID=2937524 RepID=A0A8U0IIN1_9EURY|nr:OB-fold nucleic acid binding domain-containing protein [Halorussus gelatinilyticus]UPW00648.1 OB-fold nucleic acid binding domain-containing protein [Halorussus gelatinilyticus]
MGSCIICGTPADGAICDSHEQDVLFEFAGDNPNQLTPGRYYSGTVDGFAEFGVFVNIGDRVTGLLHKSELDQRLDSLDWDEGQTVFVQVTGVRDNGNVDLGWSIRQSEREFRGKLIDDPEKGAILPEEADTDDADETDDQQATTDGSGTVDPAERQAAETSESTDESEPERDAESEQETENEQEAESEQDTEREAEETTDADESDSERARVTIDSLSDRVDEQVRIEGEVVGARQTSGPTVFEVRDETATVDCAAFVEAGVRAYPEVETGDHVRLDGVVELRNNELQVETDELEKLAGEDREAVENRLEAALTSEARPDDVDLLADHESVAAVHGRIRDAAEEIRRAVMESRPVIVRHNATADGYVAGAAIERAVLPLVRDEHAKSDAEYHFFDRRPLEGGDYDMADATKDVTTMLDNRERHDEKLPLFVLVAAGSTDESRDGLELLDIYDAPRVTVDAGYPDEGVADLADVAVNPYLDGTDAADLTVGVLGANVAAHVNADVREDVSHLPAVSYWDDAPDDYTDLASDAGYDADHTTALREAVALEAFYQSYEDKRELITDLLFEHEKRDLAEHVGEQFREKLETELDTVEPNLSVRGANGVSFTVLDTEAFTHRFDFPPTGVLLDEIHRRELGAEGAPGDEHVTLGFGEDEIHVRSDGRVNVREVAADAADEAPNAGISAKGTRDGAVEFLTGERDAALDAVVEAISQRL